jgi:hypothetical protein
MKLAIAAIVLFAATAAAANAQNGPNPMAPPVSSAPPPAPGSTLSPILTQPGPVLQPFHASPAAPAPQALAPVDQQKMQSYRNGLIIQQQSLERQGIGLGSDQYRTIQQQLNQLNGSSR